MTIEIADRLVKLRKKYGYSQEELADKLGLSRQAVSKWERAEASPDTDNLICLAKLYGVSLDELLSTDEDIETIVKEQVKEEEPKVEEEEQPKEEKKKAKEGVRIDKNGIIIQDDDGSTVTINKEGIKCVDGDDIVIKKPETEEEKDKVLRVMGSVEGALFLLSAVAYVLLGTLLPQFNSPYNLWQFGWIVFFLPEIICSIVRAIRKKNAQRFNVTFFVCFAFFFVCMALPTFLPSFPFPLWHPMWVVFLGIPIYHVIVGVIHKATGKTKFVCSVKHSDDDDDDDDDDEEDKRKDN